MLLRGGSEKRGKEGGRGIGGEQKGREEEGKGRKGGANPQIL